MLFVMGKYVIILNKVNQGRIGEGKLWRKDS